MLNTFATAIATKQLLNRYVVYSIFMIIKMF